jgi:hypothetical protein
MNNRPKPVSSGRGGQYSASTTPIVLDGTIDCQAADWDAACDLSANAWADSDTIFRAEPTPLHFEHTCTVHALARLLHQMRAVALDCGVTP